jgi:aqualysin 1
MKQITSLHISKINTLALTLLFVAGVIITVFNIIVFARPTEAVKKDSDRYIVVFREDVLDPSAVALEHSKAQKAKVHAVYKKALKGYAATLSTGQIKSLQNDKRVAYIEQDGIATTQATQTGATWGLDRIDQANLPLNNSFTYSGLGTGVNNYVIDTGISSSHSDFGGRVLDGYDAVDGSLPAADCNGHGTHVAGTIGGSTYGVAKNTNLIAVRVLDCSGSGYWSWIIAGIDYVTTHHQSSGKPSVANMSLGGSASQAVDSAVKNSIMSGVTYVIAAGNSSADACRYSPARVPEAVTIGATNRNDTRPNWSNWGKCIDWFAPGDGITSAWIGSNTATKSISGTSMAAPHSAGVAALYLQNNPNASPQQVRDALYILTTKSKVGQSKSINNHLLFTNL